MMTELNSQLSKCITHYFEPAVPGETFREVLNLVGDSTRYPKELATPVVRNQALSQLVFRTDFLQTRIQEWIAEAPRGEYSPQILLERTFTLLGRQASRNLVACIEVQKILGTLPRKKNDRFAVLPSDQIRFATAAEHLAEERGFAFSDWAYIGGLHFDLLQACLLRQKGPRDALAAFSTIFSDSLKEARIAYEIGSLLGEFRMNHLLFPTALSLGLGRVLMHALFPKELLGKSYNAFLAEADKLKFGRWEHLELRELDRFGITHQELASLFVSWIGLMEGVEKAVRYSGSPCYLKNSHPVEYQLANVLHLARATASSRPRIESHFLAMRELRLTAERLDGLMKKENR